MQNYQYDPYLVTLDNYKIYNYLLKNNPCFWDDRYQCWIVSRYSDITSCLRNYKRYTSNYGITFETLRKFEDIISNYNLPFFEMDPPHHSIQRRIINRILSSQIEKNLKLDVENIFQNCMNSFNLKNPIDVVNTIFLEYPILVISYIFGISENESKFLKHESKKLFNLSPIDDQIDAIKNIGKFFKNNTPQKIKEILEEELYILNIKNNDIITIAASIVIAGHETITAELSNLIYNCYIYKNEFKKIIENKKLIKNFVEESLRHRYMSHFVIRTSTEDHYLYNSRIKKGDAVLFLNGSGDLDPEIYGENSSAFSIERDYSKANLSFGYGAHSCPGQNLAKLEINTALEYIINNYKDFYITDKKLLSRFNLSGAVWENLYVQF